MLLGVAPLRVRALELSRYWQWLALLMICIGAFNLTALWLDYRRFEALFLPRVTDADRQQTPGIMMRLHQNLLLRPYAEVAMALPMTLVSISADFPGLAISCWAARMAAASDVLTASARAT